MSLVNITSRLINTTRTSLHVMLDSKKDLEPSHSGLFGPSSEGRTFIEIDHERGDPYVTEFKKQDKKQDDLFKESKKALNMVDKCVFR